MTCDCAPDPDALVRGAWSEGLRPPESLTVSEWADRYRVLSPKVASEPGPWRTDRAPYLREIMDCLSSRSGIREVVLMCGAQLGKTETGNNWLGYIIDVDPGPAMAVQPTIELAKRYSQQRVASMIADTPRLAERVSDNLSRGDSNTIFLKDFPGGTLVIGGANSARTLRSMPVRYLFLDEIDAYPLDVDGEGDPIALAEARMRTFPLGKVLKVSTTTLKGYSRIEQAWLASDMRRYHVPCPHCGERQPLEFGADKPYGLKADRDDAGRVTYAFYVCRACAAIIDEHAKTQMLDAGRWVAEQPGPGRAAGFHLSSLYSPLGWLSWRQIMQDWFDAQAAAAQGDITRLKGFVNTILAEPFEEAGDQQIEHELAQRAEDYALRWMPAGALLLAAGVDVQDNRLHALLWGWGRGEEAWLIDRKVIYGSPDDPATWQALDSWLDDPVPHQFGGRFRPNAVAVDSGGHFTQAVYHYCRQRQPRGMIAIAGERMANKPVLNRATSVDVDYRGVKIKGGLKLWWVGVDTAKATLYRRLRAIEQPGPGYLHFPRGVPGDFYEQLTAERLVTTFVNGFPKQTWKKQPGRRNEDLDCAVYAYAAAHYAGLTHRTEADWQAVEASLKPKEPSKRAASAAQGTRRRAAGSAYAGGRGR